MKKILKTLAIIIVAIFVIVAATLIALPHLINLNKAQIENKFHEATGRTLIIDGPFSLNFFPDIHLHTGKLAITNPSSLPKGNFIKLDSLDLHVEILPFLKGTLNLSSLATENLDINLIQNKKINNWTFVQEKSDKDKAKDSDMNLVLQKMIFKGLQFSYRNLSTGKNIQLKKFDIAINKDGGYIKLSKDKVKLNNATLAVNDMDLSADVDSKLKPFKLENTIKANNINVDKYTKLNGFKLNLKSLSLQGNLNTESALDNLHGEENISIKHMTLYGLDINKLNKNINKAINDMTVFKRIISSTQTYATINKIRKALKKIAGDKNKDYKETTDLGDFTANVKVKKAIFTVSKCKLDGPNIAANCDGEIDTKKKSINFITYIRLKNKGEQSVINNIDFPYYVEGSLAAPNKGIDWSNVMKQVTEYNVHEDKSVVTKTVDSVKGLFK